MTAAGNFLVTATRREKLRNRVPMGQVCERWRPVSWGREWRTGGTTQLSQQLRAEPPNGTPAEPGPIDGIRSRQAPGHPQDETSRGIAAP